MRHVWFTLLTALALAMSACGGGAPATAGDGYTPANQARAGDRCATEGSYAGACARTEDTCPGGGFRPAALRCDTTHRWTCVPEVSLGDCNSNTCNPSTGTIGAPCEIDGTTCPNGSRATGVTMCGAGGQWSCVPFGQTCGSASDAGPTDVTSDASMATALIVAYRRPMSTQLIAGQMEAPVLDIDLTALHDVNVQLPDVSFETIAGQLRNEFGRPSFIDASLLDVDARSIIGTPIPITIGPDGRLTPIHFPAFRMNEGDHKALSVHVNVNVAIEDREAGTQFRAIAGAGNGRFFQDNAVLANGVPVPPEAIRGNARMEGALMTLARPRVRVTIGDRVRSHTIVRNEGSAGALDLAIYNETDARVTSQYVHLHGVVDVGRGYMGGDISRSVTSCYLMYHEAISGRPVGSTTDGSIIFPNVGIPIEPHGVEHLTLYCNTTSVVRNETMGDRIAFGVYDHADFGFTDGAGMPTRTYVEPGLFQQLNNPTVVLTIAQRGQLEASYTPGTNYPVTGDGGGARHVVISAQLRTTAESGTFSRLGVRIIGASECVDSIALTRDGGIIGGWVPVPAGSHGVTAVASTVIPIEMWTWAPIQVSARFRRTGTGPDACHSGSVVTFSVAQGALGDFSGWDDPYAADIYVVGNTSGAILRTHEPVYTGDTVTVL